MASKEEEYKEIFLAEALENFEEINRLLTELEKNPEDENAINAIFRITHTLKGNAGAMGFDSIAELSHVIEDLFASVREGKIKVDKELFTILFKAIDVLGNLITGLREDKKVAYKGIKTKLQVFLRTKLEQSGNAKPADSDAAIEAPKTKALENPDKIKEVKVKNSKEETKESSSVEPETPLLKDKESSDELELQSLAEAIEAQQSLPPTPMETGNASDETIDELNIEDNIEPDDTVDEEETVDTKMTFSDLVQVPVRKLDQLLNLVGELVIERDRIIASYQESQGTNEFSRLTRISSDLQYSVMDVRMVQISFLFNKFHRVVRDAAIDENKKVRLNLEGTDTEIDRNILQIISDSLIHVVRNAIGHGVENQEERKSAGKPEEGTITMRAYSENDAVNLEIEDDGKGVDIERVRSKAIKNGLVSREVAEQMPDEEVIMFIFEPGFSTQEKVNKISGRGVGMDVVKKSVDAIGGNIKVESKPGLGTKIKLILPSSMAVKGSLLFELNQEVFAIPLTYTESVISLYKSEIHRVANGLATTYLGKTISIVYLKDLFSLNDLTKEISTTQLCKSFEGMHEEEKIEIVIVSYNNRMLGIVVDKLLQQKEIVEKPLAKPVDYVKTISGVTIMGNGNVCLVINVPNIISNIFGNGLTNLKETSKTIS